MSAFAAKLAAGEFLVTAEINPPKSADPAVVTRRATALRGVVDAANVTDSNRAVVAMSALAAALLVKQAGVEPIVQMTGRDRNRIAIQSELLGAAALGLESFVFMTGDDPRQGNHPDAVHVKDLDGVGLVRAAAALRDGHFLSGEDVRVPPRYTIGATASPFAADAAGELRKTIEKVAAGAEFLQTQPVFDVAAFARWAKAVADAAPRPVGLLAGVFVLRSAEQAERLAKVPGVGVPPGAVQRLRAATDQEAEGVALAAELASELRATKGVAGVHIFAIEWPQAVARVVERAGLGVRSDAQRAAPPH